MKMNGYIERLDQLVGMDHELSINLILASLPYSFAQFLLNYRMNNIMSTIPELMNLLKIVEPSLRKEKNHVMLMDSSISKKSSKNKKKRKSTQVVGGLGEKKAKELTPKGTCFLYG